MPAPYQEIRLALECDRETAQQIAQRIEEEILPSLALKLTSCEFVTRLSHHLPLPEQPSQS